MCAAIMVLQLGFHLMVGSAFRVRATGKFQVVFHSSFRKHRRAAELGGKTSASFQIQVSFLSRRAAELRQDSPLVEIGRAHV